MTQTTSAVLEKYQVRKNKKQKSAFINYVSEIASENGFDVNVEKGAFGVRNIVVGDPEKAKVVFGAHYDTCAVLPFPNFLAPKNIFVYILYILLLCIPCSALLLVTKNLAFDGMIALEMPFDTIILIYKLIPVFATVVLLWLALFGVANKHTVNDNTSGVTLLLDIITSCPPSSRGEIALVFFDLEEAGLFGSMAFASKHKKVMKNKLLVNFDCVSDGENILFAVRRGAVKYMPVIRQAFESDGTVSVEVADKGIFYPSDQMNFPCGVGVGAFKKTKKLGILYIDRIHTKKDTVYRHENIDFLKNGSLKLIDIL